jgi:hypothetical protein
MSSSSHKKIMENPVRKWRLPEDTLAMAWPPWHSPNAGLPNEASNQWHSRTSEKPMVYIPSKYQKL